MQELFRKIRAKRLKVGISHISAKIIPSKLGISCPQKPEIHSLAEGHPYTMPTT
jgi:hypothetical protein